MTSHPLLITCAPGIEDVLEREMKALDFVPGTRVKGGVFTTGTDEELWRACLRLRTASRIQRLIHRGPAKREQQVEDTLLGLDYSAILKKGQGIGIELHDSGKPIQKIVALANSIERRLNKKLGARKEMAKDLKDDYIRLVVHRRQGELRVGVEVAGKALHKRGWRQGGHEAPLQETLAAALVLLSGYDGDAPFVDPFCGSGTLAIEAAYIALDKAPLVHRKKGEFSFEHFADFEPRRYRVVLEAERARRRTRPTAPILACDNDERRVKNAAKNAERARVGHQMTFAVADARSPAHRLGSGVVVSNLPYGVRLGDPVLVTRLMRSFAKTLSHHYGDWDVTLLVAKEGAPDELTSLAESVRAVKNGPIDCLILEL
jgi:putative N6-adenine-specific DNA methylase